jgi:hypothetical protein
MSWDVFGSWLLGLAAGGLAGYGLAVRRWLRRQIGPVTHDLGRTTNRAWFPPGDRLEVRGAGNQLLSVFTVTSVDPDGRVYARPAPLSEADW